MIVANEHTLINCTCKSRLGCSLLLFTLIPQYLKFNWSKIRENKRNLQTKRWNPPSFCLLSWASMISRSFQTVWRMREAWKWETYVRSQSFLYLHVGRRKIQISPTPGPTKPIKSPPHALPPPLPPAGITLIGALKQGIFKSGNLL